MLKASTTTQIPTFALIDEALRRAEAPTDAAEAHGSLCGLVCGLGDSGQSAWLAETLPDALAGGQASAAVAEQTAAVLRVLAFRTRAALEDADMTFQPLLPDEAEPLAQRVDGLAQWCQGFNHGLFVAARIGDAEAELRGGNTGEIVSDFADMAKAAVDDEEPDADGEAAYVELVEYIRVSVQLVYEELTAVRQRVQSAGRH